MPFDPDAYLAAQATPPEAETAEPEGKPAVAANVFNPNTYLATQPAAFNPDEYLEQANAKTAQYGSGSEIAKTALEQGLSGLTLGGSKYIETHGVPDLLGPGIGFGPITSSEAIAGREAANPVTSFGANVLGTGALIAGTGGLGGLAEGAGTAARLGVAGLEGAGIGGANQVTDDWSQNKALDAQKIAAAAGIGGLLGLAGAGVVEGVKAKFFPRVNPEEAASAAATGTPPDGVVPINGSTSVPPPTGPLGAPAAGPIINPEAAGLPPLKPQAPAGTIEEGLERLQKAKESGVDLDRPNGAVVRDALANVDLGDANPTELQLASIGNPDITNKWNLGRQEAGEFGNFVRGTENLQKVRAIERLDKTIADIAPDASVTGDAKAGGLRTNEITTNRYQAVKDATIPALERLKNAGIGEDDHLPGMVMALTEGKNNNLANMFDTSGADIKVKPYADNMKINPDTYKAMARLVSNLDDGKTSLEDLMHYRNSMGDSVVRDTAGAIKSISEIGTLKAKAMGYIQNYVQGIDPSLEVRAPLRDWAINEGYREAIENLGGSVGRKEAGVVQKSIPENVNDNFFRNSETVRQLKTFLGNGPEFNEILANHLAEQRAKVTSPDNVLSSANFGKILKGNQDALGTAFSDNPGTLQRLGRITAIMRNLPDRPLANPPNTARSLVEMAKKFPFFRPVEGVAEVGHELLEIAKEKLTEKAINAQLNRSLSVKAADNHASAAIQKNAAKTSMLIDRGVKGLFSGFASQARKANK